MGINIAHIKKEHKYVKTYTKEDYLYVSSLKHGLQTSIVVLDCFYLHPENKTVTTIPQYIIDLSLNSLDMESLNLKILLDTSTNNYTYLNDKILVYDYTFGGLEDFYYLV